ncbi:hypothetical protein GF352_01970 [archaeon]|nr:hypothetical protein [archaeon]
MGKNKGVDLTKILGKDKVKEMLGKKPVEGSEKPKQEFKPKEPEEKEINEYQHWQMQHLMGLANVITRTQYEKGALPGESSTITALHTLDNKNVKIKAPLKKILSDIDLNYLPASFLEFILSDDDKKSIDKKINETYSEDDAYLKIEREEVIGFAYSENATFRLLINDLTRFHEQYDLENKIDGNEEVSLEELVRIYTRASETAVMKKEKIRSPKEL